MVIRRTLLIAAALAALSGCGTIYKKGNSCPGYVENGHCRDVIETYEATHDFDRERYRRLLRGQQTDSTGGSRRGSGQSAQARESGVGTAPYAPYMVSEDHPRPILTQAIPVRVFVDPYEDKAGRLHTPGFVYVRATEPRWIFGDQETSDARVVSPLVPRQ